MKDKGDFHCSLPRYEEDNHTGWNFGQMEYKGNRTMALDHGGVLTLKVFSCSLCSTIHMEEDVTLKPLPPYET